MGVLQLHPSHPTHPRRERPPPAHVRPSRFPRPPPHRLSHSKALTLAGNRMLLQNRFSIQTSRSARRSLLRSDWVRGSRRPAASPRRGGAGGGTEGEQTSRAQGYRRPRWRAFSLPRGSVCSLLSLASRSNGRDSESLLPRTHWLGEPSEGQCAREVTQREPV